MLRRWLHSLRYGTCGPYWVKGLPVLVAYDVGPIAEAIALAQQAASTGLRPLVIGLTYDANAKDWHLGVSRCGTDFTWVTTLRRKQRAEALVQWVIYASQQNALDDDTAFAAFLGEIATWGDA